MASTYSSLHVHIVYATKNRAPMIGDSWRNELHAYTGGTLRGLGAEPRMIGGVTDHVHLLATVKPSLSVSDLVKDLKVATSIWAKEHYAGFAWQAGYGVFSVSRSDIPTVAAYIGRQEEHHRTVSSLEELRKLLQEAGIEPDERFFE